MSPPSPPSSSSSSPADTGAAADARDARSRASSSTSTTSTTTAEAPVPGFRRGVHLYDTKSKAKEHRCNDRLEDVVQGLFEGNPLLTVPPAWRVFMRCMRSAEGEEPKDAFLYHTPKWLAIERERERERERAKRRGGWFGGG